MEIFLDPGLDTSICLKMLRGSMSYMLISMAWSHHEIIQKRPGKVRYPFFIDAEKSRTRKLSGSECPSSTHAWHFSYQT